MGKIAKERGVAGQVAYSVEVTYPGEGTTSLRFVGDVNGTPGPVVMCTASNPRGTFVTNPGRFGSTFDAEWVEQFVLGSY